MIKLKKYLNSLNLISESSWKKIETIFVKKPLNKGDYFIKEGQKAVKVAFLQKGIVRAFYRTENGKEYNKHFFTNPSFIGGYSSLITGRINTINQQAITDCEIIVADYDKFTSLYSSCPDVETAARKLAELSFVEKEQREIEIVLLDASERYLLLREQFPNLEQLIPQYHIASFLGISPTQLSRIRKKL
ncbi:Crp/Fnr family transcriptional regulator [Yeosuana marina]|uniref:Crp/Fnr family transcriptional regulator n=1 Tax=Yeosuana marina TaxID=1565536 RepID=UPI00141DD0E7|nr:Crp/Fnr family transcriptional regulator [Yeosuana marina]